MPTSFSSTSDPSGFPDPDLNGRYRILEKLGGGGMGDVFAAEDVELQRKVALKFLAPRLAGDERARKRFIAEARAASALDHPNICTIYEIGRMGDEQMFIAMAHYPGETLAAKLTRGPLPIEQALDYTVQVARGLAKAHDRGIVHRDIKPANLLITDDQIGKILDFGLAKLENQHITQPGHTLGTISYMSPEQARGQQVDHRTDIWSLGVVLYELLTGSLPFRGDYPQAVIYHILHTEPPALSSLRPGTPEAVEQTVMRALAKETDARLGSMDELIAGLGTGVLSARTVPTPPFHTQGPTASPGVVGAAASTITLAVLPFDDLSPGHDHEYFSDGLTEELITDLSQVRSLRILSRTSAMMLKGTPKNPPTLGRELQVDFVLRGSVRKAGDQLRITAQLINTQTDALVWAQKYTGSTEDIFDIQETVSRAIVDALEVRLSPEEEQRLAHRPIDDVRAYESYLRARQEIWRWTEDALDRARTHLQHALDILGENAVLYAGLGYVEWQSVNVGLQPRSHLHVAEDLAKKAFELDPSLAHSHRLFGLIQVGRRDMLGAIQHLQRALLIAPNDADSLSWLCLIYGYVGRTSEATPLVERLLAIDPLNPTNIALPGWIRLLDGQFERALEPFRKMYEMDPQSPAHRYALAQVLAFNRQYDEAFELIDRLAEDTPDMPLAQLMVFFKLALQGDRKAAEDTLTPSLEALARDGLSFAWVMADSFALLDQPDPALDWLEIAVDLGFLHRALFERIDPFLESVRGEERFERLMRKVSAASQQLHDSLSFTGSAL